MLSKQDFLDWKQHPVTKEVFAQLRSRVEEIRGLLGDSAGVDPAQDRFFVGSIQAYKDILFMEFEQEETQ